MRLRGTPDRVFLAVQDTGSGMSCEVLDQLFKPLFTTKRKGGGSRIGLPFSRALMNAHGGVIEVASEMGEGSTFTVVLPR